MTGRTHARTHARAHEENMQNDLYDAKLRLFRAKRVLSRANVKLFRARMYLVFLKFLRIKNKVAMAAYRLMFMRPG
jgi:hypothetical protein